MTRSKSLISQDLLFVVAVVAGCCVFLVGCPTTPPTGGDPCAGITCDEGEECVDGECVAVDPCEGVTCDEGEECMDGECVAVDPCEGITCDEGEECVDGVCVAVVPGPAETFPISLHATREGKRTFYEADDGFATLTNIPYDDLPCKDCHGATFADGTPIDNATYTPGCRDCHADPANPSEAIADSVCLSCHGRQGAEQNLFSDVHREEGLGCVNCHTASDMHGDGTAYPSFLAEGETDVACEDCHVEDGSAPPPGSNTYHNTHLATVDCSACHVASVSSCYNCHFESEVAHTGKRFFNQSPRTGFKMLMNYEGKVHTATFQSLVYDGLTFVAIAPFFGHSITKEGIGCSDCHRNEAIQAYDDTGTIVVTSWDETAEGAARLIGPTGVIPIPPDWETALEFAFLNYTGEATDAINGAENLPLWQFLKTEKDGQHIVYGEPLTEAQMASLRLNFGG